MAIIANVLSVFSKNANALRNQVGCLSNHFPTKENDGKNANLLCLFIFVLQIRLSLSEVPTPATQPFVYNVQLWQGLQLH